MHSLKPEPFFDSNGKLMAWFSELAPSGIRRMSANPHANGGRLKKIPALAGFPRLCGYKFEKPGYDQA